MKTHSLSIRYWLIIASTLVLSACANMSNMASTTRIQPLDSAAVVPYQKLLILGVFESFEHRSLLERAVVQDIRNINVDAVAVAATSMMKTTTPLNTETVLAIIEESGVDAVLVTQLMNMSDSATKVKSRSPQASWKVRPTYYFNVWDVRLTEYMEPQYMETEMSVVLRTELFVKESKEQVWAIETKAEVVKDSSRPDHHPLANSQAADIVKFLKADGIISK